MTFQIKFHQIRAFVEVARQGSIRGASRVLTLSQPALTKSIKELEEGMAAQLFVRRSKGVALTECGESFYQHASLILEELRSAQDDIRQRQGQQAGQINVGMGASVARMLMPPVIVRFHQQHPQVKVRIMEGQLVSMINELRQGELDFTINTYYQGPYDHEFTFERLFEKPFAIFCREGHPARGATSINDLLKYSWTMPTPRGSYYKQLEELFNHRAQIPRVGIVCETFSSCISLVAQSDFLSILPQELGCDPLLAHRLVMLPVQETLPKATYYLIQRRDSRQTPLTESLITQFRRQARQVICPPN
ncbi:LysR family transcriptional regulator [Enterobacteriaceae bacterium H4N4]|uniref:LysR family transcriptional regulator n=1 Tax=Silvania confinis TaxID=2926470 RepID=A0A9J6QG05_9ENTR|nr:LysR family transcriptional regulator [Silvania confinis]MCU6671423.1 LysR family transcriptional regulator [Silvania confinis]